MKRTRKVDSGYWRGLAGGHGKKDERGKMKNKGGLEISTSRMFGLINHDN